MSKKFLSSIFILLVLCISIMLSACGNSNESKIVYKLSSDKSYYTVDEYNGNATEVEIPSVYNELPVTEINEYAFAYNKSIKKIILPDTITRIGDAAFCDCNNLLELRIPNSVKFFGKGAFSKCDLLNYNEYDNALYLGNESNLYVVLVKPKDTNIISCNVNETNKCIMYNAFSNCNKLVSVTISDSVVRIDDRAFINCSSLKNLTIGNNVEYIGSKAFMGCTSLVKVVIPDSVIFLNDATFSGCTSLVSVVVGKNVKYILGDTFLTCFKLVEVYNLSSKKMYKGSTYDGMLCYYALDVYTDLNDKSKLFEYEDFIFYYDSDESKGSCYLLDYLGSDTTLELPELITLNGDTIESYAIYNRAFESNKTLENVILHDNIISIGDGAFLDCSALKEINIPNSVNYIGTQAFYLCQKLKDVNFNDINGWYVDSSPVTNISSMILNYPSMAASYLNDKYTNLNWRKK